MRSDSNLRPGRGGRAPRSPRALLFDFNGVLLDDEPVHFSAYRILLRPLGVRLTRAAYEARYLPLDDHSACARMLADAGLPGADRGGARVARLVRAKRRLYRDLVRRRGAGIGPGAAALVRLLAARMPLGIVSGAARAEIVPALRAAAIRDCFGAIVSAESVTRPKPAPDGYRQGLRRVASGRPAAVVALEDSPLGILAARRAGLAVIGVATSYPAARLRRAGALAVVRSLARPARVLDLIDRAARNGTRGARATQKRS